MNTRHHFPRYRQQSWKGYSLVTIAVLSLGLSACSSGDSGQNESRQEGNGRDDRDNGGSGRDDSDQESNGSDDDDGDEVLSPLDQLLGRSSDPVAQRAQDLEIEEEISRCMRAEGFEYEPIDYAAQVDDQPLEERWGTDEFGKKYGYGAMRGYELNLKDEPVPLDPNQEYLASLGENERDAYNKALNGDWGNMGTVDPVAPSPEDRGCGWRARDKMKVSDPLENPEILAEVESFDIEDDPALQELDQEWIACMEPSLSDFDLPSMPQKPTDMDWVAGILKTNAAGQEFIPFSSEEEASEYKESGDIMYESATNPDGSGYMILGEPKEISGEEIDAVTKHEVELWKADKACQDEVGYKEFQRQLEQEFVDRMLVQFPELGDE